MLDPYSNQPAQHLYTAIDNRGMPGRFDYFEGTDGHLFLGTLPENLGDHYAGGYQPIPADEAALAIASLTDAYRLESISRFVSGGRFLEIGPWIGLVAYAAKQAGFDVSVMEMDERCVDLLAAAGIRAIQTADPAAALREGKETYDAIGLWHSIEHLPRPWGVIEAAAAAVRPGGVLLVAAPNPDSAQRHVLGRRWLHLDAPRHLHLMPARAYEAIGHAAGLKTVMLTTDDQLGRTLDHDGWAFEARRRVGNLPILRTLAGRLWAPRLARRFRRAGTLDGAGFTLVMQRPVA